MYIKGSEPTIPENSLYLNSNMPKNSNMRRVQSEAVFSSKNSLNHLERTITSSIQDVQLEDLVKYNTNSKIFGISKSKWEKRVAIINTDKMLRIFKCGSSKTQYNADTKEFVLDFNRNKPNQSVPLSTFQANFMRSDSEQTPLIMTLSSPASTQVIQLSIDENVSDVWYKVLKDSCFKVYPIPPPFPSNPGSVYRVFSQKCREKGRKQLKRDKIIKIGLF